jgi:hypothetical protein
MLKYWGEPEELRLDTGINPAWTAAVESDCFLNPGTELEAKLSLMTSNHWLLAFIAAAAW